MQSGERGLNQRQVFRGIGPVVIQADRGGEVALESCGVASEIGFTVDNFGFRFRSLGCRWVRQFDRGNRQGRVHDGKTGSFGVSNHFNCATTRIQTDNCATLHS
ncbi:hypothetical protein D3C84_1103180 [compost metagenome]